MLDVLNFLLAKENITAVISTSVHTYRELSVVENRSIKDGKYSRAFSYLTPAWLSASPIGPAIDEIGYFRYDCFEDVANISEYNTRMDLESVPKYSLKTLQRLYRLIDGHSERYAKAVLGEYKHLFGGCSFQFIPSPSVVISLVKDSSIFLGCIQVSCVTGKINVVSRTSAEIADIVIDLVDKTSHVEFLEEGYIDE